MLTQHSLRLLSVCLTALCVCVSFSIFVFLQVLTAAVTQASLQSMLHKLLTAGPSAFNVTTLLSQAAQLSTQGMAEVQSPSTLLLTDVVLQFN